MSGYLKCVVANKATLGGYIGMTTGVALCSLLLLTPDSAKGLHDILRIAGLTVGMSGFILNAMTAFGMETYDAYQRMSRYLERTRTLDGLFYRFYNSSYGVSSGAQLAAKEVGLEQLIEK
jgi:hypothetical protein